MAVKPQAKPEPAKSKDEAQDGPLMDGNAAFKKMLAKGKERGYVTVDELNAALPKAEQLSSDQIEDMHAMLSDMGINVVENEEPDEGEGGEAPASGDGEQE